MKNNIVSLASQSKQDEEDIIEILSGLLALAENHQLKTISVFVTDKNNDFRLVQSSCPNRYEDMGLLLAGILNRFHGDADHD